jgi:NADH:ubiquinone oxidoreductase subunit 2 (subunit N)
MLIPEFILGLIALLQGLLLVIPGGKTTGRITELLSVFGLGGAAVFLAVFQQLPSGTFYFEMLEDQALFRIVRAAILLSAVLVSRIVAGTKELPEGRKTEVHFLVTILALICDLLILSRHATLSCILLALGSWMGFFLGGLAYRGREEGEAVLKHWIQASLALTLGLGAVVLLSLLAGGAFFSGIGEYMKAQPPYSPQGLLVVASLFLPFFMAGGLFPFHFVAIDRDHGLPWAVQIALSVTFQGTVAVAAWKMGVVVFGRFAQGEVSEGLRVFQLCGLTGGFWLALFALSQDNSKRLFSALLGAQWGAVMAAGARSTSLSATAMVYGFSAVFVWSAVFGLVWSRFQEFAGSEKISSVYGAAKSNRAYGLVLLLALACPLCVPGFPGFPSILYLLAAMIEQKSLIFLGAEAVLLSLLCLTGIRIGTDLLFRRSLPLAESTSSSTLAGFSRLVREELPPAFLASAGSK